MSIQIVNVSGTENQRVAENSPYAFHVDELGEVYDLVASEAPEAEGLLQAIDDTIVGGRVYRPSEDGPRRLFAATGPGRASKIEGLLFAEGTEAAGRVFSEVNASIWVTAEGRWIPGAKHLFNNYMSERRRTDIRRYFYRYGFADIDNQHQEVGERSTQNTWGLPILSTTLITPVGNQEGDVQVPFRYEHLDDVVAVSGLQVPDSLRKLIMDAVQGHHATQELAAEVDQQVQSA